MTEPKVQNGAYASWSKSKTLVQLKFVVWGFYPNNILKLKGGHAIMLCPHCKLETLDITPQDLFMVNYLKPKDVLVDEIIKTVQSINDREKIEIIYKIIMAIK